MRSTVLVGTLGPGTLPKSGPVGIRYLTDIERISVSGVYRNVNREGQVSSGNCRRGIAGRGMGRRVMGSRSVISRKIVDNSYACTHVLALILWLNSFR